MKLIYPYKRFIKTQNRFRRRIKLIRDDYSTKSEWEYLYLLSNIIFEMWLCWCRFCREVIYASCNGTTTRSGIIIKGRSGNNSIERLSYEIKEYCRGKKPKTGATIKGFYQEPTWGDVNILLKTIAPLNPYNSNTLISGFGLSLNGPKHMQIVRNTTAHLTMQAVKDFNPIKVFYTGRIMRHPIDLIWWIDSQKNTEAVYSWIEDLEDIAELVTR